MSKISVIVPFDHGTALLRDALESLKVQSFRDFETILVHDTLEKPDPSPVSEHPYKIKTSKEELKELLSEYPGVRPFDVSRPGGVAAARNEGLKHAEGDYILFLDADDFLLPDTLEKLYGKASESGADVVSARFIKTKLGFVSVLREGAESAEKDFYAADNGSAENQTKNAQGAGSMDTEEQADKIWTEKGENTGICPRITSVLGMLIKKTESLPEYPEETAYYSDVLFTAALYSRGVKTAYCDDAVYMKRTRSDGIRIPSLTQMKEPAKPDMLLEAYKRAREILLGCGFEKIYDVWFCRYLCRSYLKGASPAGSRWKRETAEAYAKQMTKTDKSIFPVFTKQEKKVLSAFASGRIKKALRTARVVHFNLKKEGIFGSMNQWKLWVFRKFFLRLPIKKELVLFESLLGKAYGGNVKYIYEYMVREKLPYKFVWILNDKNPSIPGKHKTCKPSSWRYMYYLARYHYYVNDMRQPAWYDKRPGSVFLETWHGTPLKKLAFDVDEIRMAAGSNYKMSFFKATRVWDYLISDNTFSTEAFSTAFLFPKDKIIETGYPRNDILYTGNNPEFIKKIRQEIGVPEGKKTILYAPTWRDDEYYEKGKYKFTLALDLKLLCEKLGSEYVVLLRTHYFIADNLDLSGVPEGFAIDVSRFPDIGELYVASDICITDYSSVFFDYANLRRPILFYVYDFEKYRDVLHGFYIDMEKELPGPLLYTSEEVCDAIAGIEKTETVYKERYDSFYDRFCSLDDGHAAERTVRKVFTEAYERAD